MGSRAIRCCFSVPAEGDYPNGLSKQSSGTEEMAATPPCRETNVADHFNENLQCHLNEIFDKIQVYERRMSELKQFFIKYWSEQEWLTTIEQKKLPAVRQNVSGLAETPAYELTNISHL